MLNLACIANSFWAFGALSESQCTDGGYGSYLPILNAVGLIAAILDLILAHYLYFTFITNGNWPSCLYAD